MEKTCQKTIQQPGGSASRQICLLVENICRLGCMTTKNFMHAMRAEIARPVSTGNSLSRLIKHLEFHSGKSGSRREVKKQLLRLQPFRRRHSYWPLAAMRRRSSVLEYECPRELKWQRLSVCSRPVNGASLYSSLKNRTSQSNCSRISMRSASVS